MGFIVVPVSLTIVPPLCVMVLGLLEEEEEEKKELLQNGVLVVFRLAT